MGPWLRHGKHTWEANGCLGLEDEVASGPMSSDTDILSELDAILVRYARERLQRLLEAEAAPIHGSKPAVGKTAAPAAKIASAKQAAPAAKAAKAKAAKAKIAPAKAAPAKIAPAKVVPAKPAAKPAKLDAKTRAINEAKRIAGTKPVACPVPKCAKPGVRRFANFCVVHAESLSKAEKKRLRAAQVAAAQATLAKAAAPTKAPKA